MKLIKNVFSFFLYFFFLHFFVHSCILSREIKKCTIIYTPSVIPSFLLNPMFTRQNLVHVKLMALTKNKTKSKQTKSNQFKCTSDHFKTLDILSVQRFLFYTKIYRIYNHLPHHSLLSFPLSLSLLSLSLSFFLYKYIYIYIYICPMTHDEQNGIW